MIEYQWTVDKLITDTVDEVSDVVVQVEWCLKGTSLSGATYEMHQNVDLDTSDLSSFTEYNDLTELQVIQWVKSTLGETTITQKENFIADRIAHIENGQQQQSNNDLPWNDS